jgi:hypothetical protein
MQKIRASGEQIFKTRLESELTQKDCFPEGGEMV